MTSAVGGGGGSQKNRQKEQNQLFCDSDRGTPCYDLDTTFGHFFKSNGSDGF